MSLITGNTQLLGVIGNPVEHSLSPVMHNAAIAHLELDYVYIPLPVKGKDLEKAIAGFEAIDLVGFNVTIPHKQQILAFLSEVSPEAELVGAVNTVWRTENGWSGTNTDVEGFISPLRNMGRDWSKVMPLVLGNGGAARAVVVGLMQLGCSQIHVVGRDRQKLEEFWQSWQDVRVREALRIESWSELSGLVSETGLIVNTTPVGMYPNVEESPVDEELMRNLQQDAIAYDLIYTPLPTKFLRQARDRGAKTIDGLEMLVQQGAAALEIWLQQPAPVEVMRQSLREYLGLGNSSQVRSNKY